MNATSSSPCGQGAIETIAYVLLHCIFFKDSWTQFITTYLIKHPGNTEEDELCKTLLATDVNCTLRRSYASNMIPRLCTSIEWENQTPSKTKSAGFGPPQNLHCYLELSLSLFFKHWNRTIMTSLAQRCTTGYHLHINDTRSKPMDILPRMVSCRC